MMLHCWLLAPVQVASTMGAPSSVRASATSRHLPLKSAWISTVELDDSGGNDDAEAGAAASRPAPRPRASTAMLERMFMVPPMEPYVSGVM
ncbi:hypothetical protein HS99_0005925 [Kitasatospora aureofaciens]|uniref:Uncharacterized protein n=1 Tax=Kitasatospora aureofaciens TaxID=1894 RepID=A0A1E7N9K3_KITAU|nr:hypothetical protein HS99_0005925 [Kitasatospora aureofaciens]